MFLHSPCPQRLENLSQGHPLYGLDLRTLSDERLVDAATRAIIQDWASVWHHLDHQNTAHSEIANLASSILRRVTRVIVWSTRLARLTEDSDFSLERLDELLEATTLTYIQMVGAFDAIAIINGILSGLTSYPAMAWQRRHFRDSVRLVAPRAAELMDDGTPGDLYFQAIRAFRNTIHRRMPGVGTSTSHQGDPAHTKAILTLESNGHREIIDTFTAAGWTKFVGIDLAGPDWLFLRPETAVNLLKAEGIPLLNELLAATPADRLGPVRFALDEDATLYPRQMQDYALEYLHLRHLVPKPR